MEGKKGIVRRKRNLPSPPLSPEAKRRKCISCRKPFHSSCFAHRFCDRCQGKVIDDIPAYEHINDRRRAGRSAGPS